MRNLLCGACLALSAGPAFGSSVVDDDVLAKRVIEVEARVRELNVQLQQNGPAAEAADRRLIDAQVLYELKNYEAAAIILLDVVEKFPNSTAYPDALFTLADSLFKARDYLSARRYFEKLIELGPVGRHYPDALQRLIELSLYTGDYGPVEGYLSRLATVPYGFQGTSVPYVKGKYYYSRQLYDQALQAFLEMPAGTPYWFHVQYFIGAIKVSQGKLPEAANIYVGLLHVEPKSDAEKEITELAHLALARIYYSMEQLTPAETEYLKISTRSDSYPEALYEQAWLAVKGKDFKKAYLALDLLLTVKPDGPLAPEVKLLIGNLHVRQSEWTEATSRFIKTRDEYEVVKKQMDDATKRQGDATSYFHEMFEKNLQTFDIQTLLPPLAAKWVVDDPTIDKLGNLVGDVSDLRRSLDESEEILGRLEKAVAGPAKVNIFPDLARARAQALEVGNTLLELENTLTEHERVLMSPVAGAESAQLNTVTGNRQRLQKQFAAIPSGKDSYQARIKLAKASFDEIDRRAAEVFVALQSYKAERVAIEKYFNDTGQGDDPAVKEAYRKQLADAVAIEEELNKSFNEIRHDIADSSSSVGVDDAQMQQEETLKKQLGEAMVTEQSTFALLRDRLSGSDRTKANQIDSILARARACDEQLVSFNGRIDTLVENRLADIRVTMEEEKHNVQEYRTRLAGYQGETADVGGNVAAQTFQAIAERFYQIVVRADVGIIDVAWALKQTKTDDNSRLVREKKNELKLLDDEFKEVLKE